MENFVITVILIVLIGTIILYLVREKKKGKKCVCCPYAKQCDSHGHCNGDCSGNFNHSEKQ